MKTAESPPSVLLVDDDDITLDILSQAVIKAGYQVDTATNGRQAWDKLLANGYKILISDWEMPEMDGLALCRRIREENPGGYVYIILVTSHNETADLVQGLEAGADDFLSKPVNPAELVVRLRGAGRVLALESRDVVIYALAKLAESRDPETGAHIERVQSYCAILSNYLMEHPQWTGKLSRQFVQVIRATSPLHDIGKIGIPDCILLKPGRYNDSEFSIMKSHTTIGGQAMEAALNRHPSAHYLRVARDIALYHHERFDGTGYPQGLAGDDIPICARIVALADVYDALTSKRLYKDAFANTVAANIINEGNGSHFDPLLVQAFNERRQAFEETRVRLRDEGAPPAINPSA